MTKINTSKMMEEETTGLVDSYNRRISDYWCETFNREEEEENPEDNDVESDATKVVPESDNIGIVKTIIKQESNVQDDEDKNNSPKQNSKGEKDQASTTPKTVCAPTKASCPGAVSVSSKEDGVAIIDDMLAEQNALLDKQNSMQEATNNKNDPAAEDSHVERKQEEDDTIVGDNESVFTTTPTPPALNRGSQREVAAQPGALRVSGIGMTSDDEQVGVTQPSDATDNNNNQNSSTTIDQGGEETLISAFVVEEVDEEMQAKVAEEKARDKLTQEMVKGEVVDEKSNSSYDKVRPLLIIACLVVVVIVIVLAVVLSGEKDTDQPTSSGETTVSEAPPTPLSDYDYLVEVLSPISSRDLLLNATTSQNKALNWILDEDAFFSDNKGDNNTLQSILETTLIERYVVAVLYYSAQGDRWTRDLSFLSNASVCKWPPKTDEEAEIDGVGCNPNGQVTDVNLSAMNLNGTIPAELGQLKFLRNFRVDENLLYGTIPDEMGQLDLLVTFKVEHNGISGTIPETFAALNNLEIFGASGNGLSGTIPSRIFQIESLTSVTAEWMHLSGTIPEVRARGKLESLWLGGNELQGSIPASLYTLPDLRSLSLYENALTGTLSNSIGNLNKLFIMYIDVNNFHGTLPTELGQMISMEFLWLQFNEFTGSIPSELGNLGKFGVFRELVTGFTPLSGEVPMELSLLTSVSTIDLSNSSISGDMDPVFCEDEALAIPKLMADCGGEPAEVNCSCCTVCCNDVTGSCETNIAGVCSQTAGQVIDPEQPIELVIVQDDVKPVDPICECSEIPPSANQTSVSGKIPVMTLSCNESLGCEVCTPDGSVCGQRFVGYSWNEGGIWTHQRMGFQYTKGFDDFLLLEFDVSAQTPPYPETMYLNGVKCNEIKSEAVCIDGNPGFEVDCSNVQEGAIYSQCDGLVDDAGILEYFTPTMYGVKSSCET